MSDEFENISILIVENEDPLGDLIETVLDTVDTRKIYKARNPQHGLVLYQTIKPDLIIVDMHIHPEGGLEMISQIKKLEETSSTSTPFILMTLYATPEELNQIKMLGVDELLLKPFSFDDLVRRVSYVMKNRKQPNRRGIQK